MTDREDIAKEIKHRFFDNENSYKSFREIKNGEIFPITREQAIADWHIAQLEVSKREAYIKGKIDAVLEKEIKIQKRIEAAKREVRREKKEPILSNYVSKKKVIAFKKYLEQNFVEGHEDEIFKRLDNIIDGK